MKDAAIIFDRARTMIAALQHPSVPNHTTLVALLEPGIAPEYCAPLQRDPQPEVGRISDDDLLAALTEALQVNPAVHDGCILVRAPSCDLGDGDFEVVGWSYRLFAPPSGLPRDANRGSAYESGIDFSAVDGVLAVFCVRKDGIIELRDGRARQMNVDVGGQ